MECKSALVEASGNLQEAEIVLRKKGIASADKKATRATKQGVIGSYIHPGAQLGVLGFDDAILGGRDLGEMGAGALQGTVDRRRRGFENLSRLGGAELQDIPKDQDRTLARR